MLSVSMNVDERSADATLLAPFYKGYFACAEVGYFNCNIQRILRGTIHWKRSQRLQ